MGYDTLNEPSSGYIGVANLADFPSNQILKSQQAPTPFQSMVLGAGNPVVVDYWQRSLLGLKKTGEVLVNQERVSAWKEGHSCVWARHGVWDPQTLQLLQPRYFSQKADGTPHHFLEDFWLPFVNKYSQAIREAHPGAAMFVEPSVNEEPPLWGENDVKGPLVYAPHWYDGLTLYNKTFAMFNLNILAISRGTSSPFGTIRVGDRSIETGFIEQLAFIKREGLEMVGRHPCVIGETGIPFDMDDKHAYKTGDYSKHIRAMNATMRAMESNLLAFTIWNYCSDNTELRGDQW